MVGDSFSGTKDATEVVNPNEPNSIVTMRTLKREMQIFRLLAPRWKLSMIILYFS